jgi:hypothetical protein
MKRWTRWCSRPSRPMPLQLCRKLPATTVCRSHLSRLIQRPPAVSSMRLRRVSVACFSSTAPQTVMTNLILLPLLALPLLLPLQPHLRQHPCLASLPGSSVRNDSARNGSSAQGSSTSRGLKVWSSRSGKSASTTLFPNAKPTPAPSDFSISAHDYDKAMDQEHGINIMRTRFWDPMSTDWNPEKFYDSVISKYHCPFVCE